VTEPFYTIVDDQPRIDCTVTESKNEEIDPRFVKIIWEGELELPPDRPAGQEIQVTYSFDDNQIMHCSFLDVASGNETTIDLSLAGGGPTGDDDDEGGDGPTDDGINQFLVD
jgi:molecular chaperone DnaK